MEQSFFRHKTYVISGASRGIGKATGMLLAAQGANIVIASKSVTEHPRLKGTIYSAAQEMEAVGGKALPVPCDIRNEEMIATVVTKAIDRFGGIDGLINNASAISLSDTDELSTKRYDLMMDINVRGTFLLTRHCLPFLKQSAHAHIINLSPPLNITPEWLSPHPAYSISKFNMTMMAMAWAEAYKRIPIAVNSLWPATTIATAAVNNLLGGTQLMARSRKPEIVADAILWILRQLPESFSGRQLIDEVVLRESGMQDFTKYAVMPGKDLQRDLFLKDTNSY